MEFGKLTYTEIKEAAKSNWIVLVPSGCTEQQGLHLPVDFDTWFTEKLYNSASLLASERFNIESLVLPPLPFGPTPEHLGFGAGYINVPKDLHGSVFREILKTLTEQSFKRIIIWQGCGQQQLAPMVNSFIEGLDRSINVLIPAMPYQGIWEDFVGSDIPRGHADAFSTSISMHLRPDDVREKETCNPDFTMPDWSNPHSRMRFLHHTGKD
ncbi:MAG: creatininase family protein [Anaerolineaceae bacterium]|nr:creatininase family protein [Anaerolineaceae bacterium]